MYKSKRERPKNLLLARELEKASKKPGKAVEGLLAGPPKPTGGGRRPGAPPTRRPGKLYLILHEDGGRCHRGLGWAGGVRESAESLAEAREMAAECPSGPGTRHTLLTYVLYDERQLRPRRK